MHYNCAMYCTIYTLLNALTIPQGLSMSQSGSAFYNEFIRFSHCQINFEYMHSAFSLIDSALYIEALINSCRQ